jgi:undecaprenyl-diphosphatase
MRDFHLSRVSIALLVSFGMLCIAVLAGWTASADESLVIWAGNSRSPGLTNLMLFLTLLGDGVIIAVLGLGCCALLWRLGRRYCAQMLLVGALSAEVIYLVAKAGFQRPRPDLIERLSGAGWYSFPSGHTMMGTVIWGLALLLVATSVKQLWIRRLLLAVAVIVPIGIAMSRVYLGVHYPSDVLGAMLLGVAWVMFWLDRSSRSLKPIS